MNAYLLPAGLVSSAAGFWKVSPGPMIAWVWMLPLWFSLATRMLSKKDPLTLLTTLAIHFHLGDVRSFDFPSGIFSHVIHAAVDSSLRLNAETPLTIFDTIVEGTHHTLEFARQCGARKFLFPSSGAVYGRQPPDLAHLPEDFPGAPQYSRYSLRLRGR